jgi:hypothetical protein
MKRRVMKTKQQGGAFGDPTTTTVEGYPANPNDTTVVVPGEGSMSLKDYMNAYTGDPKPDTQP